MQLDNTRIAIRERAYSDILDLSLQLLRVYAKPLLLTLALGILPFAVLNYFLLSSLAERFALDDSARSTYVWFLLLLQLWELPLATAPTTLLLGQIMFESSIDSRRLMRDLIGSLPQLLLLQVAMRGVLVMFVITIVLLFARGPYLNEVILLERNPLWRSRKRGMSTLRRSGILHAGMTSDLLPRAMYSAVVATLLVGVLCLAVIFVRSSLVDSRISDQVLMTMYLPAALWLTSGFFTIARFLSYLDLRIRREGWEIELRLRAETRRLQGELA